MISDIPSINKINLSNTTSFVADITKESVDKDALPDKNLDMVRNILFGDQARDNEKRIANLERFVRLTINAWNEETQKKFDVMTRDIHLLKELLTEETKSRREDTLLSRNRLDALNRELHSTNKQNQTTHDALHGLVNGEVDKLEKQMEQMRGDIMMKLKQAEEQLRSDKTDRKSLALMLHTVARQLHDGVKVE